MPKRRLLWHLFPSYALLILAAVLASGWTAVSLVESSYLASARNDLRARADFLATQLGDNGPDHVAWKALARRYFQASGIRITLIERGGRVNFDSSDRPQELENSRGRPELEQALDGQAQDAIRFNPGLDHRVLYMAVPLEHDRPTSAALYLSAPLTELDLLVSRLRFWLLAVGALMVALALPLAWRVTRGITQPLEAFAQAAARLASGHWTARATVPDAEETAELAESFNRMADQLQSRIAVLIQNNNEQKAVLASMAEGVLAVDSQERIISVNPASVRLLGLDQTQAQGRRLQEVVRNADLSRFITRALACPDPIQADVLLHGDRERVMQAHGSALHDLDGRAIGAVIVLNDVTDFRRLEHIRRDFVANVSHELKTPVTSIKGFVETLLDGAMHDPVDSERFLRIVAKQSDRLHAIIEDLLSLSKIEQSEDADDIALEPGSIRGVLENAVNTCRPAATEKNIEIKLECDGQPMARINPLLLEQAIVNLLDNAVKYSDPGREVRVWTVSDDGELSINVADRGCGIAAEHLARVFERFYRVDRARSRKLGGTGLGLAIVKHIALAHHGRVTVDSTLGVGSTFTMHLPRV
jgi:two-component system phosphate regulon sensor histidine kinase PhoR